MYQIVSYHHENYQKVTDFKLKSRSLWNDHINYTRNAIISIVAGLSDVSSVSERLLQNQEDIGNHVSLYYTETDIATLIELLKQHILIAGDVIKGTEGSEALWRENGQKIVTHMSKMNPAFWPSEKIEPIWTKHLDLTISQVTSRKQSLWSADITAYDANHKCINELADLFSSGAIYQNMSQFC